MNRILMLLAAVCLFSVSCTKDPGEGGAASISGNVETEVRLVLTNPNTFQYIRNAPDQEVFIQYGDNVSPDDRVFTNYDGEFEFLSLREGKYTIYIYSKDTTGIATVDPNRMVILKEVEIVDRKEEVDAGILRNYDDN